MRLPRAIDEWYLQRLERHRERSPSEVLVQLVRGGLRLREGYMAIHRRTLEAYIATANHGAYATYVACLTDTFGSDFVTHLERWLEADRVIPAAAPIETGARTND